MPIAFSEPGAEAVLGATALESLGFMVDPVAQKLIARNLRMLRVCTWGTNGECGAYSLGRSELVCLP